MFGTGPLYPAGILAVGIGLHTFLKRWTTLAIVTLFVMLDLTSSGGVFTQHLQIGFFGGPHEFWMGAGFLETVRGFLYLGNEVGYRVASLFAWLAVGLALLVGALRRGAASRGSSAARGWCARPPRHRGTDRRVGDGPLNPARGPGTTR